MAVTPRDMVALVVVAKTTPHLAFTEVVAVEPLLDLDQVELAVTAVEAKAVRLLADTAMLPLVLFKAVAVAAVALLVAVVAQKAVRLAVTALLNSLTQSRN